jgi:hypothetical protein
MAAAAYDTAFARDLVGAGADVRAKNRRGAEPLHEAVTLARWTAGRGGSGSPAAKAEQAKIVSMLSAATD